MHWPRAAFFAVALALLVFILYWPGRAFPFSTIDDIGYVTNNPIVLAGLSPHGIAWAFKSTACANYHPLVWIVEMAIVSCFGAKPLAFHLTNVALHAATSVLLLCFLYRATSALWRSVAVAALFAVHPLRLESVEWIAELKDCLSMTLLMATLLFWLEYATHRRRWCYWAALIAYAMGLLAKPMLVTLPVLLLLLDIWPLARGRLVSRLLLEKIPFLLLAILSSCATIIAQHNGGAIIAFEKVSLGFRLYNAVLAYAYYLRDTFQPIDLSIEYLHPVYLHKGISWAVLLVAVTLLLALTAGVVALARQGRRAPLVGWLWFLVTLAPVIGIIQVGEAQRADRYTYLPHVGLLIGLFWLISDPVWKRFEQARVAGTLATVAALIMLTMLTRQQLVYWRNDEVLTRHAVELEPRNFMARLFLGQTLMFKHRPAEAAEQFAAAVEVLPRVARVHRSLAEAYTASGRPNLSMPEWNMALALDSHVLDPSPRARHLYALTLAQGGAVNEAGRQWEIVLQQVPDDVEVRGYYALALEKLGRIDDARRQLHIALQYMPDSTAIPAKLRMLDKAYPPATLP